MRSEFTGHIAMKFEFDLNEFEFVFHEFDLNVFKTVLSIQRFFNLTEYREVIVKKFTAH